MNIVYPSKEQTLMKFYIKIGITLIVILGCSYCLKQKIPPIDTGTLEVYFGVFGSVYAIVTGFILLVVITNYNNIKKYISSEINALQDLRDFLLYIDSDQKSVRLIRIRVGHYVDSVIHKEWASLVNGKHIDSDTSPELYAIIKSVNQVKINQNDLSDKIAVKKLINTIGRITTFRTNRLTSVNEKIPPVMMHLILFLSSCIVLPFSLIGVSNWLWWIINAFNGFTIIYIYMIIKDLNDPFHGSWNIKPIQFQEFIDSLEENQFSTHEPMEDKVSTTSKTQS